MYSIFWLCILEPYWGWRRRGRFIRAHLLKFTTYTYFTRDVPVRDAGTVYVYNVVHQKVEHRRYNPTNIRASSALAYTFSSSPQLHGGTSSSLMIVHKIFGQKKMNPLHPLIFVLYSRVVKVTLSSCNLRRRENSLTFGVHSSKLKSLLGERSRARQDINY